MNLPQQQQENKDSWRSTGDYTSEHLDLLDTLTTSTWNAAQEEMLERVETLAYELKFAHIEFGDERHDWHDAALNKLIAALSSLRAGENTEV